jgi:hypothetical protein
MQVCCEDHYVMKCLVDFDSSRSVPNQDEE